MAMEFMGYRLQPLPQDEVAIIDFSSSSTNTQASISYRRDHLWRTNRELSLHRRRRQDEVIITSSLYQNIHHHHQQWYNHFRNILLLDNASYEQLLELGERIGNINTGLSEENITTCLKTRTVHQHHHHVSTLTTSTSVDLLDEEEEEEEIFNDTCIVCQDEYKDNDTIGTLKCGHEYHRDCIKEWLLLKNVCPICKRPALSTTTTTTS